MLPQLSCISVSYGPVSRFRHRCSSRYLRISPLHREFHSPLPHSSPVVSCAGFELSPKISHKTCGTAYAPFTPNNSEQRSPPSYYRGFWHEVSRGFFIRYRHYRPGRKEFTSQGTSSSTRRCCVRVPPIAQNSPLLPPVGVWTVLQFQCVRAPSQADTDHRLGGPLPRQLTNLPRPPPQADCSFDP